MSLKQSAEILYYTNKDGVQEISGVVIRNAQLSYASLTAPRPNLDGTKLQYTATVLIKDEDTKNVYLDAYNQVYAKAFAEGIYGKGPGNKFQVPFKGPDLEADGKPKPFQEDVVLQIPTTMNENKQPSLFLKMPGEQLREANADDVDQFYSGSIADVIIGLWPYGKSKDTAFNEGIKPFLNSVCQVDYGTPFTGRDHKAEAISVFGGSADSLAVFNKAPSAPAAPTPAPAAPTQAPAAPTPAPAAPTPAPAAPTPAPAAPTPVAPTQAPAAPVAPSAPQATTPPAFTPNPSVPPIAPTPEATTGAPSFEDLMGQGNK